MSEVPGPDSRQEPDEARDLLVAEEEVGDRLPDRSLRPRHLREFVGQARARAQLEVVLQSARLRGVSCDHVLLAGPPGLGKTSLAAIIANELGAPFRVTSGPALERAGDLAAILTALEDGDVLFIDEVHRLPRPVEELLYPAMEDFEIDVVLGKGPGAKSLRLQLPRFTLVGATTRSGLIAAPLRDRFGVVGRLDFYQPTDLALIVRRAADILGVRLDEEAADLLSTRSRGTPRIANRLLRRVRDVAQVQGIPVVDAAIAMEALELFGVDAMGLDRLDRDVLVALCDRFGGGPVGLGTLAACVGEEPRTLEEVVEPYLLQLGFLHRTPRGRVATARAFAHVERAMPVGFVQEALIEATDPLDL